MWRSKDSVLQASPKGKRAGATCRQIPTRAPAPPPGPGEAKEDSPSRQKSLASEAADDTQVPLEQSP